MTNNNISFRARLVTNIKIKNKYKAAFKEVQEGVELGTRNITGTLYKTQSPTKGIMSTHVSNRLMKGGSGFYEGNELFTESINQQLKQYSPKQLIKKYIREFKAITLRDEHDKKVSQLKSSIYTFARKFAASDKAARISQSNGNEIFSKRFSYIADCCAHKASQELQLLERTKAAFNRKIKSMIKMDSDLKQLL